MFPDRMNPAERRTMAITEEARHRMYQRLEELLGRDEAATLMEHLPPIGWADVATKRDLDRLEAATKSDIESLAVSTKREIEGLGVNTKRDLENLGNVLRVEFLREQRNLIFAMLAANSTLAGLAFAAAKLV
jgi:hypothetical protein